MRIRELGIENFRKFRQPIRLTGFEDGLNLVCDRNEAGKSTILEALRAALFERHGSKSDRIRSFRPHGDEVAPTVELVFEVDGQSWRLHKRFLQGASASLEGPNGRATGDEAEEKLQALLGFSRAGNRGADDDSRGALGLLWVEQGQSFVLGAPGQAARRTLEEVLAGEVGAVTGGQRTTAVLQTIEKDLGELFTGTGKPTKHLLAAREAWATADETARMARDELGQFESVLDRLESKRNEHRRLVSDLDDPDHVERLAQLNADIHRARIAGETLRTAELVLRDAAGQRQRLDARTATRTKLRTQHAAAARAADAAQATVIEHAHTVDAARTAESDAVAALDDARAQLRAAEEERRAAGEQRTAASRLRAVATAFARLDTAEAIAAEWEIARHLVASTMVTDDTVEQMQRLEQALVQARAAATAGAAVMEVALEPGAPEVRLNAVAVAGAIRAVVTEPQTLDIPGVGTVRVEPPASGEAALAALRACEQDLTDFLVALGADNTAAVRDAARVRARAADAAARLAAQLAATCPADATLGIGTGLEALRGALAAETRPTASLPEAASPDPAFDPEANWQGVRSAEREAEGRRQAALDALQAARLEEVRLAGQVERANAEARRLADDLAAELEDLSDEELAIQLAEAKSQEARAILGRDEAQRAAEGLDEVTLVRRRDALVQQRERLREDLLTLVGDVAMLEERAKTLGGSGPASRAEAALEAAEAAKASYERLHEEAETLALLARSIRDAQRDAARRYLAPVTQRVAPYVARLLPNATLAFGEDLRPQLLVRGGREEAADDLSKGTQEQLAVLTRIAFADLLTEKGKPASLMLDDALVFADDDRFEVMLEILTEAASRMQVIILSCRTRAYRGLEAVRIALA